MGSSSSNIVGVTEDDYDDIIQDYTSTYHHPPGNTHHYTDHTHVSPPPGSSSSHLLGLAGSCSAGTQGRRGRGRGTHTGETQPRSFLKYFLNVYCSVSIAFSLSDTQERNFERGSYEYNIIQEWVIDTGIWLYWSENQRKNKENKLNGMNTKGNDEEGDDKSIKARRIKDTQGLSCEEM